MSIDNNHIKSLRQKFLDEKCTIFDSKHEFTDLMASALNLYAYDFYSINIISLETQNVFPNDEYIILYEKFRENMIIYNWIEEGKRLISTNTEIMKNLEKILSFEMVYESYLEFITAKMCVDYIAKKIEKKSLIEM
jgi:hypothetical protein